MAVVMVVPVKSISNSVGAFESDRSCASSRKLAAFVLLCARKFDEKKENERKREREIRRRRFEVDAPLASV